MLKKKYTIEKITDEYGVKKNIKVDVNMSLYRYRSINQYTINAFINDEIYGSLPISFNDPYDCSFTYDKSELEKYLCENNFKIEQLDEFIDSLNSKKAFWIASFTEKIDSTIMWAHYANSSTGFALEYKFGDLYISGESIKEEQKRLLKEIIKYSNTVLELTTGKKIFEKMNVNESIDRGIDIIPSIAPVEYTNKKSNIDAFVKKMIDNMTNNVIQESNDLNQKIDNINQISINEELRNIREQKLAEILFFKESNWKYEKEWRLLKQNISLDGFAYNMHEKIISLKPVAIYLGEYISKYDEIVLTNIAKEKKISVYKMKTIYKKDRLELRAYLTS
ncbi:MAG: DUF2971 domain-containing protein [Bacilli bacterium]|nr:DUF2971 domain-containing protein [Bacilli bacterium]